MHVVRFTIACLALVLSPRFALTQATRATTEATGPSHASAVIRIESDDRFTQPQKAADPVVAALTSTTLVDPAVEAVLHLSSADWPKVAQVEVAAAGDSAIILTVTVNATQPPDAAKRLLHELAERVMRSFNSVDPAVAEQTARQKLTAERTQLDNRLRVLRTELAALERTNESDAFSRRGGDGGPYTTKSVEQELAAAKDQSASSQAVIDTIDQQLKELPTTDTSVNEIRSRLISQRAEARIALARSTAAVESCNRRLAELAAAATQPAATQPVRTIAEVHAEQMEVQNRRNNVDGELSQLANQFSRTPTGRLKLILIDGTQR